MALREMLLKLGIDVDKKAEQQALSGLDKIKAAAKLVAGAFAAIKGAQAFLGVTDEIRNLADEIDKTSQQLGLSAQALEEFRHAANLSGVDARAMSDTLGKLQKNAFEASTGNKTLAEDFALLGVNVVDATGKVKSAEVLLGEMADGFVGLDNETEKVGLSLNLMGRAGRRLLPMLNVGSEGISAMREEARQLGGVFGDELIAKSVQLTDDQARLDFAMRGLKATIASEIMPTVIEMAQTFIKVAVVLRGPLSTAVRFVRRIFSGFAHAVSFVSDKLGVLGDVLIGLTATATVLGTVFLLVGKNAFIAGAKAAAGWLILNAPLILTAVLLGLIIGAVLLLIEDFVAMGEGGESVTGTIVQGFIDLAKELGSWGAAVKEMIFNVFNYWFGTSKETFDAIADAVTTLFTMLTAPVEAFVGYVINTVGTLVTFFSDIFAGNVLQAFSNLWDNLRFTAKELVDDILSFFKPMFNFVTKGLSALADFIGIEFGGEIKQVSETAARVVQPAANVVGVSPVSVVAPGAAAAAAATGAPSVVNQPQTDINVEVDARGVPDAQSVGPLVAQEVDAAMQRRDRQMLQSYVQIAEGS